MTSPSLALQDAVVLNLKANSSITSVLSTRVYDKAPQNVSFPMITIGEPQTIQDDAGCIEAFEVYVDVNVWCRAVGKVQCQQLSELVRKSLHGTNLSLPNDLAAVLIEHENTRILTDPDGVTTHGVVTFRALIEAA